MIIFVLMKNLTKLFWAAVLALVCAEVPAQELIRHVNPLVGTAGFGNVYPGAQVPFGGIQISPDTDDYDYDTAAGYKYTRDAILQYEDIKDGAELLFVMQ